MTHPNPKRLTLVALLLTGLMPAWAQVDSPIAVVASFSILGDLTHVVGGSRVSVTTLAGPDADAHAFEPSPQHVKAVLGAKLLVINGLNFEPWAQKLAKSAGFKGLTVVASKGIALRGTPPDPHAWQNPNHVVHYVQNIATGLAQVDPSGAAIYQANADAYALKLRAFDTWAKAQFATIPMAKRQVITSHDAFGHLGAQYQVKFLAPEGINADSEPSAKHVAGLIRQIQREKVKAVFVENMRSPKLLAQLGKDTGVTVGATLYSDALSGPQGPAASYLNMMQHNVTQLVAGMKLN